MSIFGLSLPPLDAVLGVGLGLVLPTVVANKVIAYIPDSMKVADASGALQVPGWLRWTIKAASVFVPSMVVRRFVSRRIGNAMLIGGVAGLLVEVVRPWLGLGHQPMLGAYVQRPARVVNFPPQGRAMGPSIQSTPERLNPAQRF